MQAWELVLSWARASGRTLIFSGLLLLLLKGVLQWARLQRKTAFRAPARRTGSRR